MGGALLAQESHTLGKVTTLGERTFEYNNRMIIGRKELQQRQSNQVNDLFRTRADVNVAGGGYMAQKVYVRGMESRLLRVTIDGAAQNGNIFHHDANTIIDPGMLKQIDVIKGAANASAGPGAIAGKMAMETIGANDFLHRGQTYGGSAAVSFYTNFGYRVNTIAAYRADKWDILGYYTNQNIYYYRDGNNDMKNLFHPTYDIENPALSDKVIGSSGQQNNILFKINGYFNEKDSLAVSYNMTRYNSERLLRPNATSALSKANDPGTQPAPFLIDFGKELAYLINVNHNLSFKYNHEGGDSFDKPRITATTFLNVRSGNYKPVRNPFAYTSNEPTNPYYVSEVDSWCAANPSQCQPGTITPVAGGGYDIGYSANSPQMVPIHQAYDMTPPNAQNPTPNDWTLGNADAEGTLQRDIFLINSGVNVNVQHPISPDYGNVFEYGAIYQNLSAFSGLGKKNGLYPGNINPNDPSGPGLPYRHYYVDPDDEYNQNMSTANPAYRNLPQNSYSIGNIIGGYVQANYNFLKNLIVGAGTRYDIYTLKDKDGDNHLTSGFSPSATILYNPIESLGLKLSYAYVTKGALPGDGVLMRDPSVIYEKNLKPTIGQNVEFNIDYNNPYFNVRGAGFYQVINNFVNSYGQDISKNGGGNATAKNLTGNLPETIVIFGYEVSGNVKYKGFTGTFSIARSWPTVANPTGYHKGYYLLADTYALAATYGNVFILKADYVFKHAGLSLTWLSRFVTNMFYNGYSIYYPGYGLMPVHKPGYGVHSIFVNWTPPYKHWSGLRLSAVFNNIFNKQYVNQTSVWQASADAPHEDMVARNGHIRMALPEPGFNARFEISYQY
ncbi:Iron-regulated outer membrane protein FrpB [Helicobacter sp. NHP19-003]|uniref:Iron-regulated outer membrane protein FrpB n=2 Tax=Helicobacter gastrocanis TaxID=2849641 RepID=A0ABN6I0L5_9HELI|nr:Iron-regulated outer membrane protein FrpB [Helicobacter sp. NHP19-003]